MEEERIRLLSEIKRIRGWLSVYYPGVLEEYIEYTVEMELAKINKKKGEKT
jgi:hypothetical protein